MSYRVKLLVLFLGALAVLLVLNVGYSAIETFSRLNSVEADRDQWQRPRDVIQALELRPGNVVVDLGCGSGYFSLKLSTPVGPGGQVIAEDIRRLPLIFLWFRAAARKEHNVKVVLGDPTDPHLPSHVDAVLISNTYHEFTQSHSILVDVYEALRSKGRLIVVDREPKLANNSDLQSAEHEISAAQVETELRQTKFDVVTRQDHFIEGDSYGENWWLIAARKP